MHKLFDQGRIDRPAAFIAAELRPLLGRTNSSSLLQRRILDGAPDREKLTNGENVLATIKALNLAAMDLIADIAGQSVQSNEYEFEVDELDEASEGRTRD
jgi:hypothetical protein